MPRSVQPGGQSGQQRVRYIPRKKLGLVGAVQRIMEEQGLSQNKAAKSIGVSSSLITRWVKQHSALLDAARKPKMSSHPGPDSQLRDIEDSLLQFIFENREQGMAVNILMILFKASALSSDFAAKSVEARYSMVRRFVAKHSLVYRMGTHESQRHPDDVAEEASDFMEAMRPKVVGPHRDPNFIINMDQTPVYFSMTPATTLEIVGRKTVHVRKSTTDTKRATVAVAITASGIILPSVVVFKGQPNGRIAKEEIPTFTTDHFYACQKNAWMDERVMKQWVNVVLKPYVETAPDHIIPLLILDSYRCHMMSSVVQCIQELGVEVQHIPGGCTSLCQPVDVGFNKPFKTCIRRTWESWMIFEGMVHGTTSTPTRLEVTGWIANAFRQLKDTEMVKNAWLKTGYEWFK